MLVQLPKSLNYMTMVISYRLLLRSKQENVQNKKFNNNIKYIVHAQYQRSHINQFFS